VPTSDPDQLGPIIRELQRIQSLLQDGRHMRVLDAGAGSGKYGVLVREYLDDWRRELWLEAVEGFGDYVDRARPAFDAYDVIHRRRLEDYLKPAAIGQRFDVALLVDVLEHFDDDQGEWIVDRLLRVASRVLIATPREPSDQTQPDGGQPYGNDLETHRARWNEVDLTRPGAMGTLWVVERFIPTPRDDQLVVTVT
jgi:SAM-dependent methyltransferase